MKLVVPWFSIAARDAMDGVGGGYSTRPSSEANRVLRPAIDTHFRG